MNQPRKPWYKEPWPWVAIAIPASAVIMGFTTLYLAVSNPDPVIVDDPPPDLPVGTVISKTFYYPRAGGDAASVSKADDPIGEFSPILGDLDRVHHPLRMLLRQRQRPPRQRPQQRQVMIPHPIQVRFHRPWSVPFTCKPNQAHLHSFPLAPAFQRVIPY